MPSARCDHGRARGHADADTVIAQIIDKPCAATHPRGWVLLVGKRRCDSALSVPEAYREDVQATVATFSADTHSGTVLLDTGARLAFDADAFDRSGLRLLRLGQRLNIRVVDGQITALNLATLPLD